MFHVDTLLDLYTKVDGIVPVEKKIQLENVQMHVICWIKWKNKN